MSLLLLRLQKLALCFTSRALLLAFFRYRVLAATEHCFVLKQGFDVLVDVGANVGQFSLAFRHYNPNARIYGFEPLAGPAQIYQRLFLRDPNVTLAQVALGAERGINDIFVSSRSDSSSLRDIGDLQVKYFPGTQLSSKKKIQVEVLDQLGLPLVRTERVLLKIDVQGFETEVLRGAFETLKFVAYIYCECSFVELYKQQSKADSIVALLGMQGFELVGVYNISYSSAGQSLQGDFLFSRK